VRVWAPLSPVSGYGAGPGHFPLDFVRIGRGKLAGLPALWMPAYAGMTLVRCVMTDLFLGVEEFYDLVVESAVGGYGAAAVDCWVALEVGEGAACFLDDALEGCVVPDVHEGVDHDFDASGCD